MKKMCALRRCLCVSLCLAFIFAAVPLYSRAAEADWVERAAAELRETMVERSAELTVIHKSDSWIFSPEALGEDPASRAVLQRELRDLLDDIYDRAVAHTGIGNQGDYLRWHIQECEESFTYEYVRDGSDLRDFVYTIKFKLSYYTDAQQEAAVTAGVQAVRSRLKLTGKTDFEKIEAIYDYLCANVAYDNANLNNESYDLKYSAYAALINGVSLCQGYSSLLYRLALEEGVDCRFIFGRSRGENHSWNIVKLGGVYYNVDATWDAVTGDRRCFLKTDASMKDHSRDPAYSQPEFLAAYPMADRDYVIPTDPTPSAIPGAEPFFEEEEPGAAPDSRILILGGAAFLTAAAGGAAARVRKRRE